MNVAIIGCGLRGSLVAALLATAGVEQLSLVDGATVEEDDIGSHPLQFTPDRGVAKSEALVGKIGLINPAVHAEPFPAFVTEDNAAAILLGADYAVDCSNDAEALAHIRAACETTETTLIAAPADYDADAASVGAAAAVAGLQVEQLLDQP